MLAVPVSSVLGLLRRMIESGPSIVWDVWGANLWADLFFVGGTLGTVWASASVAAGGSRPTAGRFIGGVALALGATYVTYLAGASLAQQSLVEQGGFFAIRPVVAARGFIEIVVAGLPGLVAMAFAGPLVGLFLPRRPAPGPEAALEG